MTTLREKIFGKNKSIGQIIGDLFYIIFFGGLLITILYCVVAGALSVGAIIGR